MLEQLDNFLTTTHTYDTIIVTGTGDGELTLYSSEDDTITQDWVLTCTSGGAGATFTVEGAISGFTADATSEVAYDNGIISFTITDGATDWVATDTITFDVVRNMGTEQLYEAIRTKSGQPTAMIKTNNSETFSWSTSGSGTFPIYGTFRTCEDPFGTNTGMSFIQSTLTLSTPDWSGDAWTEDSWDSLPASWSVTCWIKNLNADTNSLAPIFTGTTDFSGSKQVLEVVGSNNELTVNGNSAAASLYSNVWQLISVTCNGTTIKAYLNDTEILSFASSTIKPLIREFGTYTHETYIASRWTDFVSHLFAKVSDFCVWSKELTLGDIGDLYIAGNSVDSSDIDLIWKLEVDPGSIMNGTTYSSLTDNGVSQTLKLNYIANGDSSTIECTTVPNYGIPSNFNTYDDIYLIYSDVSGTYNDKRCHGVHYYTNELAETNYLAAASSGQPIEKFWFMADNNRIIINYKLYDTENVTQPDPVYIMGYFGLSDNYTPCNFATSTSAVAWTNQTSSLSFGILSDNNGSLFSINNAWGAYDIDYGAGDWASLDSSTANVYLRPLEYYQSSGNAQHFGSPVGVYKINPAEVIAEDIITIDTDNYLVLQDTYKNSSDDFIAVKMV